MENYRKGENIEEELSKDKIPIENLPENFLWMHVKGGTKVQNVIEYARNALDSSEYRAVVWSGSGGNVSVVSKLVFVSLRTSLYINRRCQ